MTLLILGVLIWSLAHLAKRIFPGFRRALKGAERPMVAALVLISLVLMFVGWRASDPVFYLWTPNAALKGINNLLMLFAVYLFAVSGMKLWLSGKIRHPQLTAVKTWALAHLLVNPTLPGIILFGGLLAWAVVEVILINKKSKPAKVTPEVKVGKEIGGIVGTVVLFGLIAMIHIWFGHNPFGA
ncbi:MULTISPECIES: NnrU family protein [Thioclava]|uniref:NnrU family protein n=1 Tax=Thioclava TaxID=285107 RepID=UPI000B54140D|nr:MULTISPECIES: NnrU family protein [Thioclava]OWY11051.1 hypothetical protein B6V74_03250 [Thioclava sp. F42-5]OWY13878.1 hypothetical protein B6V72_07720 [Thioclava sp. F34-6]OWY17943.1 hypothetical protein B6V73_04860 [Thioclava sp. JM3]WGT51028.1 NnrU family protein [Thioclava nitratireducens]